MSENSYEIVLDKEQVAVRRHRQRYLKRAGFSDFPAFQLALRFDIEKERAAELLAKSGSEEWVLDQLLDD